MSKRYYELNLKQGDKIQITKDIKSFDGNKILIKQGSTGIYNGGSSEEGLIQIDGKKRNVKVYYDYIIKL